MNWNIYFQAFTVRTWRKRLSNLNTFLTPHIYWGIHITICVNYNQHKRDRFAVAADGRNLVIWLVGFIAYRWLMGVDTPVGYTLPDMVLTVLLCVLAEKLCAGKKNA